jgi:hypothetical protein
MEELNNNLPVDAATTERRPVSDAKLAANRANSLHSTGAKTEAGRKAVSMNALRHGLTSQKAFLPGDCAETYEALIQSHHARYSPDTDEERELVHIIAENAWRILKVAPEEAAIYDMGRVIHGDPLFKDITDSQRRAGLINTYVAGLYEKQLRNLRLHERRLRKQQDKDIADLKRIQAERFDKSERQKKEVADAEQTQITRARTIIKNCEAQKVPCHLADFGFDFSVSELDQVDARNSAHYRITGECLNVRHLLNQLRQSAA